MAKASQRTPDVINGCNTPPSLIPFGFHRLNPTILKAGIIENEFTNFDIYELLL